MTVPYAGKQLWVHNLLDNPAELVLAASHLNCTGVLVKAWDGPDYWSQIEGVKEAANDLGWTNFMLGAWGYHYGSNVPGEVSAMEQALANGHPDYFVMDVEQQIADNGTAGNLIEAVSASKIANAGSAYTSFGLPHLHTDFPYAAFNAYCYAFMPQIYWADFGMAPQVALSQCLANCETMGLTKPIAPVGQAYGSVVPQDIETFGQNVKLFGLPGLSFFDMDAATGLMLKAIKGL